MGINCVIFAPAIRKRGVEQVSEMSGDDKVRFSSLCCNSSSG